MTTPAENVNVNAVQFCNIKSRPSWAPPGFWNNNSGNRNVTCTRKIRPASTSNPIRANGTRKPSAWSHRWFALQIPTGPQNYTQDVSGGYWTVEADGPLFQFSTGSWATFSPWVAAAGSFPSGPINKAKTKALNQIRNNKFNLGVSLGEAKTTVSMVAESLFRVADGVRDFRKEFKLSKGQFLSFLRSGTGERRRRALKALFRDRQLREQITSGWLEYNYGWKPLVRDVDAASQALNDIVNVQKRPLRLTVKAGAEDVVDRYVSSLSNIRGDGFFTVRVAVRDVSQCHYSIVYDVPTGALQDLNQLGLTNPAEVVWELVPYSFVVDWFLDVGGWLSSMSAHVGTSFVEGSQTLMQRTDLTDDFEIVPSNSGTKVLSYPKRGWWTAGRMERTVLSSLPIPAMLPSVKNRLGLFHLATGLSLLTQRVR